MATKVRLGRLDHMHLVVPDRKQAVQWYEDTLGFERVLAHQHWWDVPGGPIHISADGGETALALFQAGDGHELTPGIGMGVSFALPGDAFITFGEALGKSMTLQGKDGRPLSVESVVDLDLCFAYGFVDPWGHELELTTYDYDQVKRHLVRQGIEPVRYW